MNHRDKKKAPRILRASIFPFFATAFPHISCSNGPNGDMFMNYMDYVDDAAMLMFTTQQVARMHAALEGPRKSIGK